MNRVLIVDSAPNDRSRYERALRELDLNADFCVNADEGSAAIRDVDRPYSVLILLWETPGPGGTTYYGRRLLDEAQIHRRGVPVLVVTRVFSLEAGMAATQAGAKGLISKPLDIDDLVDELRSLLAADVRTPRVMGALRKELIGNSPAFLDALRTAAKAIEAGGREILILGETGTGKDLLAKAIHDSGPFAGRPWVPVDMNQKALFQTELFGHEKGAYTGAVERFAGSFERAGQGTVFLNEIGDLEPGLQGQLLQVIQQREFRALGSNRVQKFEGQLIFATNKNLERDVEAGTFRSDLYYRLRRVTIQLPPLREREQDKELLFRHFLAKHGKGVEYRLSADLLRAIAEYPFPGNIRELENTVVNVITLSDSDTIRTSILLKALGQRLSQTAETRVAPPGRPGGSADAGTLRGDEESIDPFFVQLAREIPKDALLGSHRELCEALRNAASRVLLPYRLDEAKHNVTLAAKRAGMDTKTFRKYWKEAGLEPLSSREEDNDG